jgi:hypothetical protein
MLSLCAQSPAWCMMSYMPTTQLPTRTREQIARLCEFATWMERRDIIVLEAYWDGVNKFTIHKLTGISRTTIDAIIKRAGNHQ